MQAHLPKALSAAYCLEWPLLYAYHYAQKHQLECGLTETSMDQSHHYSSLLNMIIIHCPAVYVARFCARPSLSVQAMSQNSALSSWRDAYKATSFRAQVGAFAVMNGVGHRGQQGALPCHE